MAAGEYGSLCGAAHKPRRPDHPAYGITASGAPVEEGVTCAVDPEVIPLGSQVHVLYADGTVGTFRATDTGVKGEWVDIYTPDYDYAVQCGLQTLTVYWTVPEEETCDGQNKADFIQHRNGPRYPERHQDGNAAGRNRPRGFVSGRGPGPWSRSAGMIRRGAGWRENNLSEAQYIFKDDGL